LFYVRNFHGWGEMNRDPVQVFFEALHFDGSLSLDVLGVEVNIPVKAVMKDIKIVFRSLCQQNPEVVFRSWFMKRNFLRLKNGKVTKKEKKQN